MPFSDIRQRPDQSRIYDMAMRVTLIVYSLFVHLSDVVAFLNQIIERPSLLDAPDFATPMTALAASRLIPVTSKPPLMRLHC
jgi:hypothetical protein